MGCPSPTSGAPTPYDLSLSAVSTASAGATTRSFAMHQVQTASITKSWSASRYMLKRKPTNASAAAASRAPTLSQRTSARMVSVRPEAEDGHRDPRDLGVLRLLNLLAATAGDTQH